MMACGRAIRSVGAMTPNTDAALASVLTCHRAGGVLPAAVNHLTGREIHADEAWRIGLVDRLFYREAVEEAMAIAARLARASAPAMAAIKNCVDVARDLPHEQGMAVEGVALLSLFEDGEAREGIAAFLEKRVPEFR
jgi:enoyl-CoA hydratase/carnithine racemase